MRLIMMIMLLTSFGAIATDYTFDPNENFDKCYRLKDIDNTSSTSMDQCMKL